MKLRWLLTPSFYPFLFRHLKKKLLASRHKKLLLLTLPLLVILLFGSGTYALFFAGSPQPADSGSVNLQKGLVGYWKLNGNAKDSTPYSNNGTIQGTVTPTADRFGDANSAYSFDGSSGYIKTSNEFDNPEDFTVSAWFKTTSGGGIARFYGSNHTDRQLRVDASGKLVFTVWPGAFESISTTASYNDNQWHLVTVTLSPAGMLLYADGQLVATSSNTQAEDYVGSWQIGMSNTGSGWGTGNQYFSGDIDDVRVYNRALNSSEVKALYNGAGSGVHVDNLQAGLVGQWKMNGNLKDSTPYGHDCTTLYSTTHYGPDDRGQANSALYTYKDYGGWTNEDCGSATSLSLPQVSVSAWVEPTGFSSSGDGIINFGSGSFYFDSSGHLVTLLYKGGPQAFTTTATYATNQWHHVAMTYDNSTVRMYVNGSQVYSGSFSNDDLTPSGDILIGCWSSSSSGRVFEGYMDDVRLYNRALSASGVQQLYGSYDSQINLGTTTAPSGQSVSLTKGLVGYWPFNGNAKDATPYSNSGYIAPPALTADRFGNSDSAYKDFETQINVSDLPDFSSGISESAWVYDDGGTGCVTALRNHSADDIRMIVWGGGGLDINMGGKDHVSNGVIPQGSWSLITFTFDGSVLNLYVNGVLVDTFSLGITSATPKMVIIGSAGGSQEFSGSIDDVRIYNRALNADEVAALYNSQD